MSSNSIFSLTDHEVFAITTHHAGKDNAMIATWVMPASLAFDNRRLTAAISVHNYSYELIEQSGRFAVQLLSAGQSQLLLQLGLSSGRDQNKLANMTITRSPAGLPLLANTCGYAECRVVSKMDGGDRMIYLADVTAQYCDVTVFPLRKRAAFTQLSESEVQQLQQKYMQAAARDATLLKYT